VPLVLGAARHGKQHGCDDRESNSYMHFDPRTMTEGQRTTSSQSKPDRLRPLVRGSDAEDRRQRRRVCAVRGPEQVPTGLRRGFESSHGDRCVDRHRRRRMGGADHRMRRRAAGGVERAEPGATAVVGRRGGRCWLHQAQGGCDQAEGRHQQDGAHERAAAEPQRVKQRRAARSLCHGRHVSTSAAADQDACADGGRTTREIRAEYGRAATAAVATLPSRPVARSPGPPSRSARGWPRPARGPRP